MDQEPVIVGGLSRTGKTLLCSLLALHPDLAMPNRESNMWTFFYRKYGDLSQHVNFQRCLSAMLRYQGVQILNPDPDRIRSEFWQGEPTYARLFALFHRHYAEELDKPRWGVQSVCIQYYAAPILKAYPTAKIVHMLRDPRDRYAALISVRETRGWRKIAIATANWLFSARLAKSLHERYPQRYKVVRYETLVSHPDETTQKVFSFFDLEYSRATFTPERTLRYKNQDISTAYIGRYRREMSKREMAFIQSYAKREMIAHNYELETLRLSPSDYTLFYLIDQPINLAHIMGWRMRKALQLKFPARMGLSPAPHRMSPRMTDA
jgi:hypothetical protein